MRSNERTTPREHGTFACYKFGETGGDSHNGCRCRPCRDANNAYYHERKRRIEPAYVGADPAREHITFLATQGVGLKQVSKVSGVAHGALHKLVYGTPSIGRGPSKRIRKATLDSILSVTPRDGAEGSKVEAGPVWADVGRLLSRGWTKAAIAHAIGNRTGALQLSRVTVTRRNARAIHALLDQPVPATVGAAWSQHWVDNAEVTVEAMPMSDGDRVILRLVELLEARIDERPWRARAACSGKPTHIFFPARGDHRMIAAAKAICATCPVSAECLEANQHERAGIFGGTTSRERRVEAAS